MFLQTHTNNPRLISGSSRSRFSRWVALLISFIRTPQVTPTVPTPLTLRESYTDFARLPSAVLTSLNSPFFSARVPIIAQLVLSTFPTLNRPPELKLSPALDLHSRSPHPALKEFELASSHSGTVTSSGTKTTDDGSAWNQNQNQLESNLNLESFLKTTLLIAAEKDPSVLIVK
jgi:hypothetical protein